MIPFTTRTRQQAAGLWLALALGAASPLTGNAWATERFRGVVLLPASGLHLAVRDVDVLETPPAPSSSAESKSKGKAKGAPPVVASAVAQVKKGDEVEVFGKAGAWVAVKQDGKPLGFVPADALAALLDGTLAKDVTGSTAAGGYTCRYTIRFEGRTEVEMGPGRIADYDGSFVCDKTFSHLAFRAPMFMSEIPHQGGIKPVYQISLDVIGATSDPDQAFSTILFYDRDKGEVALETAFPAEWLVKGKPRARHAADVAAALGAAVEIALAAWGPKAWEAIAKGGR